MEKEKIMATNKSYWNEQQQNKKSEDDSDFRMFYSKKTVMF